MASKAGRDDKVELLRGLSWTAGASDEDLRWLGRVADAVHRPGGALVARRVVLSRWAYVVLTGTVAVGDAAHGPGAYLVPDGDVVALADAELLAFPRAEEPALHRRFPRLDAAEVTAPAGAPRPARCPMAACGWPQASKLRARSALDTARSA